jgi:hypothetical protein
VEETWFTGLADELARCLTDAEACAKACESLLESTRDATDDDSRRIVRALVAPAAIARVLVDLIDDPQLVLAACKLCRESARGAIEDLGALGVGRSTVVPALRASADSCERLLNAAATVP